VGVAVEHLGAGRPRLVLIHGFTQTGRSWQHIAADLARTNEVVVVDAPCHGDTSGVPAPIEDGGRALVDAAGAGVYVGYSMGGRYALAAALARPDAVVGLAVIGAHPGIEDEGERAERRANDEALAASIEQDGVAAFLDRWLAQPLFAGLSRDAADAADRRRNSAAGLASSLRLAGTGAQEPMWDRLRGLHIPTLALAGDQDTKFVALGERLAATIGPSARFAAIAGAGHAVHLEQSERFVSTLRTWLAGTFMP
jgi:2-succinyl-6-hydroxy-2,4-cyclohexadiene-1-carboxylate synthase